MVQNKEDWLEEQRVVVDPFIKECIPYAFDYARSLIDFKKIQTFEKDTLDVEKELDNFNSLLSKVKNYYTMKRGLNQIPHAHYELINEQIDFQKKELSIRTEQIKKEMNQDLSYILFNKCFGTLQEFLQIEGYYHKDGVVFPTVYEEILLHQKSLNGSRKDSHKRARKKAVLFVATSGYEGWELIKNTQSQTPYDQFIGK